MAKRKSGLQKKVSSIFDGVVIPGSKDEPSPVKPIAIPPSESISAPLIPPSPTELGENVNPSVLSPSEERIKPFQQQKHVSTMSRVRPSQVLLDREKARKKKELETSPDQNDARQKMLIFAVPVLIAVLAYMLYDVFFKSGYETSPGQTQERKIEQEKRAIEEAHTKIVWAIPDVYPADIRDPMIESEANYWMPGQPFGEQSSESGEESEANTGIQVSREQAWGMGLDIVISGILYSEINSSAVIDNQILHEGDVIRDATIIKINKDSVDFTREEYTFTRGQSY
jgi:hypothetical protein